MGGESWDEPATDGWYRRNVGRRIERGANRLIGLVLLTVGFFAAYFSLTRETGPDWFGAGIALILLVLAHLCFSARRSIITGFGEEPDCRQARRK